MLAKLEKSAPAVVTGVVVITALTPSVTTSNQREMPERTVILGEQSSLGTLVIEKASLNDADQVVRLTSPDYAELIVLFPIDDDVVRFDLPAGRYQPEFLSGHDWNEQAHIFNKEPRIAYGRVFTIEARETLEIKAH